MPLRGIVGGKVSKPGGTERGVELVIALAAAAEHADVEAGPIIEWRRDCRSLHIGREIGRESRRQQAQHTERDGGEKNLLHCYPLSKCSEETSGGLSRRDASADQK